jgi:hypothetical protein
MPTRAIVLTTATAGTLLLGTLAAAQAATPTQLTIYRSDSPALYASTADGDVEAGYAVVHEQRVLALAAGVHDVTLAGMPTRIDTEALSLDLPDGTGSVLSQRVLLAHGANATLGALLGQPVEVLGSGGESLAKGILLRAGEDLLVRDDAGYSTLVTQYAAVRSAAADVPAGLRLDLRIDAARTGPVTASLSYPTAGLGWRAAYVGTLAPGAACRLQFASSASIANRSGRDWQGLRLTLIAGEPNMAKGSAPRPMMSRAFAAESKMADLPEQTSLADYRSYTLPAPIDLPNDSVSQVPLYATRTVDCERTALYSVGSPGYRPPQPMLNPDFAPNEGSETTSMLALKAFDSLPAGYLRVLSADRSGTLQFIGEGRINDTPKGSQAAIALGTAFDLRATRERTKFEVDVPAHRMDEVFRIRLSNAGNTARVVTVREYPQRWRQWTLTSSSSKPSAQNPDLLEFRVNVPANGEATLDYALRYEWTAAEQPR